MITSDQGSQFESAEFKEFCEEWRIKQHFATPYHHLGNGLAERGIQTVEKMTRTSIEDQDDWSAKLPEMIYSYNTRKHCTTGVTPYSLMFNREARCRIDRMFDLERIEVDPDVNKAEARAKRVKQADRMKQNYDKRGINMANVQPGELVVWHVHEQGRGKSRKLNQRWQGPFRVEDVLRPNVLLADCNGKTKLVHLNHVKKSVTPRPLGMFRGRGRPRKLEGRCGGGVPPPPMATSHDDAESNFEPDDTLADLQDDANTE